MGLVIYEHLVHMYVKFCMHIYFHIQNNICKKKVNTNVRDHNNIVKTTVCDATF